MLLFVLHKADRVTAEAARLEASRVEVERMLEATGEPAT